MVYTTAIAPWARLMRPLIPALWLAGASCALANPGQPAADLQAHYSFLQGRLGHNSFHRPLVLDSTETPERLQGDIYAVLDHPFATVSQALTEVEPWCDILILHLNVKSCRAAGHPAAPTLLVGLGRKNDEPPEQAFPVNFAFRVNTAQADYAQILLHADTGPLGSRNYQIALEAGPLEAGRTFIHLSYSYDYGLAARLALKGYLATLGSGKVGFSVVDRGPDGAAVLVDGVRGIAERNTMRYYLAVEAYLGALAVPPADRLEKRLHDWFAATERYRLQLHELDLGEYLAMKRKEVRQSQSGPDQARPAGAAAN